MLGIESIGSYLPETRIDNHKAGQRWDLKPDFIESKIGVTERLRGSG